MSKNTTTQIGPGGGTLLTALFVVLKVTGYISWSWWWVFAPLWIGAALVALFLCVLAGIAVIVAILE